MTPASVDGSPRQGCFLTFAAVAQLVVAPYLLLAGMMAAEMSALLSAVLMPCGAAVGVAALFLLRRRRWAWRLSSVLAALALVTGVVVAFLAPAWVGGIHAAGAVIVLGALWAGRTAIVGQGAPGSAPEDFLEGDAAADSATGLGEAHDSVEAHLK